MPDLIKRNLLYFESPSMRGLYDAMEKWQNANQKRFLSASIQEDGGNFCCIALTNPSEVVITDANGRDHAIVFNNGSLRVDAD